MSVGLRLALGLARALGKPALRRQRDPGAARWLFALLARLLRAPPFALYLPQAGPVPGLWVGCGPVAPRGVVLYFHGGGYLVGAPETHRGMLARLSRLTGRRVFLPRYPLAPENPAPAAFDAALAAWDDLLRRGHDPAEIVIGGDSAGGGLALALVSALCRAGTPPAAVFAFSPWVDMTLSGASLTANASADPLLPAARIAEVRDMVVGALATDDPRISPLFAAFPGCPPVFLQVAETEILRDDTLRMADHLRAAGAAVTVDRWPDAPHVFVLLDGWLPEARAALVRLAGFLGAVMPPSFPPGES